MAHSDDNHQSSLRVAGTIMNRKVEFLVDSGAFVSIMSSRCADTLKVAPTFKSEPKLMGASGANLVVLGRTSPIPIQVSHLNFDVSFLIVKNLVASFIPGSDFLIKNGITLDFEEMTLRKGDVSIPLKADNSKLPKIFITTADKISSIRNSSTTQNAKTHSPFSRHLRAILTDGGWIRQSYVIAVTQVFYEKKK